MKRIVLIILLIASCKVSYAQFDALIHSAELGDETAQMYLGKAYLNGDKSYRIPQNNQKALEYFKMASDGSNNREAQFLIFKIYMAQKDMDFAISWLEKSADNGYAPAQQYLGYFYDHGYKGGNPQLAYKYYKMSADQGYLMALDNVGDCLRFGKGVEQNVFEARKYYQVAVDNGFVGANIGLSVSYALIGDIPKAEEHARKAIEGNYIDGYDMLAFILSNQGKYEEAHRTIQEAIDMMRSGKGIKKFAPLVGLLGNDGLIYLKEGKMDMAVKIWQQMQEIDLSYTENMDGEFCETMRTYMAGNIDVNIPVSTTISEKTFVVVIANENYRREAGVPHAHNDGAVFVEYCKKTIGIPEKNIQIFNDASLNDIRQSINWLVQIVKAYNGEAKIIFYYAGHGIPDETDKSAYLLPVDGFGADVETAYSLSKLYDTLGGLNTKSVLVLLDACFSGTKREGGMMAMSRGVAIKVEKGSPKGNTVVLSAAQGDETAYPYEEQKHGMFTYFLLKKLRMEKGNVTLGDLYEYVREQVSQQSLVQNKKSQTPAVASSPLLGDKWKQWNLK
ncbi:caspase family protein [Bacteroides sp. AN502(2024)]|uniref:caspase family protein n=1 Tax=Bacteroides sp. AN502(2024) TaxID=3160599 RepID=UPI00351787B1